MTPRKHWADLAPVPFFTRVPDASDGRRMLACDHCGRQVSLAASGYHTQPCRESKVSQGRPPPPVTFIGQVAVWEYGAWLVLSDVEEDRVRRDGEWHPVVYGRDARGYLRGPFPDPRKVKADHG